MKELEKKVAEAELKKVKDEILTYTHKVPLLWRIWLFYQ